MFPRCAADIPQVLTDKFLDHYAEYLCSNSNGDADAEDRTGASPAASLGEALAPLELMYGKAFVSAVSIALHGAEPITRYVEASSSGSSNSEGIADTTVEESSSGNARSSSWPRGSRCVYRVGEHTLYSPYLCPCGAYAYQSVRREMVWCCKHLLALRLALKVEEAVGPRQDNIRTRVIDCEAFRSIMLEGL